MASAMNKSPPDTSGGGMRQIFNDKRFRFWIIPSLLLTMALGDIVYAQIVRELDCDIPFAFNAGNTRLPAGKYVIVVPDVSETTLLQLQSADGKISVLLETISYQPDMLPKTSELVFDRIGKREFLREITVQDRQYGYQLAKSHDEVKLEKQNLKPETHRVTVKHVQ